MLLSDPSEAYERDASIRFEHDIYNGSPSAGNCCFMDIRSMHVS